MKNTQRGELAICGIEAVRALAAARPQDVRRLFFAAERAREFGPLCSLLAASKRPYRTLEAAELAKLAGTSHHQGAVAMVAEREPVPVDRALVEAWSRSGARVLALDRVGDDHNLGSIARSAAFFGWHALILGRDDGAARLSTSAYRVARGALERIPVYRDASAAGFVARCQGLVPTVGADHRASVELRAFRGRAGGGAMALVLGNEETGLSEAVRAACSVLVRIEGGGSVESLNVSQAASVFLYELAPGHGPASGGAGCA